MLPLGIRMFLWNKWPVARCERRGLGMVSLTNSSLRLMYPDKKDELENASPTESSQSHRDEQTTWDGWNDPTDCNGFGLSSSNFTIRSHIHRAYENPGEWGGPWNISSALSSKWTSDPVRTTAPGAGVGFTNSPETTPSERLIGWTRRTGLFLANGLLIIQYFLYYCLGIFLSISF